MVGNLQLFDCLLGLSLVLVATGMLIGRDLFRAIVLFILFGLLLTIAWCRLDAVDIALAEAGIGAGLTGALLLNTWAATNRKSGSRKENAGNEQSIVSDPSAAPREARRSQWTAILSSVLLVVSLILAAGGMAALIVPLAVATEIPRIETGEALAHSGVSHPVTAVLLNFRAYDTLLEVAVLLAAALAVFPLTVPRLAHDRSVDKALGVGAVLEAFIRLMVPVAAVVAVYILWTGTKAPGGAFQSAALLGAIGVLLLVSGGLSPVGTEFRWRVLMVAGLSVFLLVGLSGSLEGSAFLQYPPTYAGSLILLVEFSLTVSLTLILISFFTSISPSDDDSGTPDNLVETLVISDRESQP
jgi:multisubunit Na+/H+ antiporter MnhB subunit